MKNLLLLVFLLLSLSVGAQDIASDLATLQTKSLVTMTLVKSGPQTGFVIVTTTAFDRFGNTQGPSSVFVNPADVDAQIAAATATLAKLNAYRAALAGAK